MLNYYFYTIIVFHIYFTYLYYSTHVLILHVLISTKMIHLTPWLLSSLNFTSLMRLCSVLCQSLILLESPRTCPYQYSQLQQNLKQYSFFLPPLFLAHLLQFFNFQKPPHAFCNSSLSLLTTPSLSNTLHASYHYSLVYVSRKQILGILYIRTIFAGFFY